MQRAQLVKVANWVTGPVDASSAYDFELEGEDTLKDVLTRLGWLYTSESGKEVVAFGGALVEETHSGEGREADVPELIHDSDSCSCKDTTRTHSEDGVYFSRTGRDDTVTGHSCKCTPVIRHLQTKPRVYLAIHEVQKTII
jgi:hypothetical protein